VIPEDVLDLDAAAVLAATDELTSAQRAHDVDLLRLVLQWADLHGDDPGEGRALGSDQLVLFGGEGTPPVRELCWAQLAIARQCGEISVKHLAADALDLRHRLPLVWQAVQDLRLPAWVARKVASMSRSLGQDVVGLVDVAVMAAADQSPGRVLGIAEARVIEADLEAHRARLAADAAKVGVRRSCARPGDAVDGIDGEPATQRVTLKLPTGAALGFGATIDEVVEVIHSQLPEGERETITRGELEVKAVELISHPHAAAAFLDAAHDSGGGEGEAPVEVPKPKKRPATVYAHVSDVTLAGVVDGVARVEGIGPMLLEQLAELLQHRDIKLQPVIDLNHSHAVSGYEHPAVVKHRTLLRMLGDVFPHSTNIGYRRLDHDHPTPYVPPDRGGPPGQTGDHADAPLTRTHHRVKTHVPGYQVHQLALGAYRWVTPHGLARMVTPSGTRKIELLRDAGGRIVGEVYSGPAIEYLGVTGRESAVGPG
jgi:hypothetical protein